MLWPEGGWQRLLRGLKVERVALKWHPSGCRFLHYKVCRSYFVILLQSCERIILKSWLPVESVAIESRARKYRSGTSE
ncbi:hypothetical protein RRH01S_02_02000 [Rhizobium rhizogenes NBRC 13257]|uniref:Uncharacterized protein n=1 Tax=Rhizobium rhizogenes NBRC 13257 TaxID=1220581 RepID=A0AA87Q0E9_RHIRH|nr:hypothetical protein PMI03_02307 [Rhizobium sp. AP16]GAJ91532.1 hypothetical protein RRH01S_02_02000 [Rhizobium rhizogenes NBRC 13257]